ncbi:uncharacterized protein C8R40DRAFT_359342 [Lentinula edodes]|uniref:uncharacterized protein n=1 Tax=Lentinula edodes TaxID=5353 RepID=UPI001E8D24CF|nr:uncharacterized protein C8R40DRAFT_359342 [Lentinula edodes]KAH7873793.1 hypothetical protein C8R40DRAFT_359342 [Lentinula edodes]
MVEVRFNTAEMRTWSCNPASPSSRRLQVVSRASTAPGRPMNTVTPPRPPCAAFRSVSENMPEDRSYKVCILETAC